MPIYEYQCRECGHEFEVMQKITEGPIRKCEKCGRLKAKRMISQSSFILKGSGWYVTDYKGKNPSQTKEGSDVSENSDQSDQSDQSDRSDASDKSDTSDMSDKSDSSKKPNKDKKAGKSSKSKKTASA